MMTRIWAGLLLMGVCVSARAADVTQTFNDAQAWGAQQQTSIPGQINPGTAQTKVPNYQSTSSATNNYGNGNTSLFGMGSAKVSDCSTNPTDPQYSSQECNAVNTVAKSPSQRPQFNLSKSDPIFQAGSSVINDPSQVAGSVSGTYSGCTTKTATQPATYDTETCYLYHLVAPQTCSKIDNVTVTNQTTYCTPGVQLATSTSCPYGCITVTATCASSPGYVTITFAYSARTSCSQTQTIPENGVSYTFTCNAGFMSPTTHMYASCSGTNCTINGGLSYSPWTIQQKVTDSWNDQCSTLEAAAQ